MAQGLSKKIKRLQFAFLSPEEIRRMSAAKIITADTYDDDGYPIEMGLMDLHLGVIEPNLRCRTCGGRVNECPGHFGIIELAMPVIHVGYAKEIKRLLQATCRACGRILPDAPSARAEPVSDSDEPSAPAPRPREPKEERSCPFCHEVQHRIVLDKPTTFREDSHKITPKEVRARLERVHDDDVRALGLNPRFGRPEWMVLTVLPVPPVQVRPSITLESGERSEDDLTHKLVDVLRINQRLRENRDMGAPQLVVEDLWELLQYHVTTYFDNQTSGIPPARHRSGRPLKTLAQRLKGKDGRFRSNLSGKRVNFSARTVISPDPLLSINEVGVPAEIARGLTVPLEVTAHNQEVAKELTRRGPAPAPDAEGRYRCGVNYLIREDGQRIKVMEKNAEACAELVTPGSVVERQLIDGDVVLFNRQPSLHRMSMMAHFVRILPQKTFRFNLCDCPPYNADFDGDEMNLHVLQSQEARAEAKVLMKVEEHILSPRYGGPIIGMLHDHITAAFLLTYQDPKFTRSEVTYLLSKLRYPMPPPAGQDKDGEPFWSGKQLFSLTLPKDLTLEFRANIWARCDCPPLGCKHDAYVVIENGVLKAGAIDKKAIAFEKGAILDAIARTSGHVAGPAVPRRDEPARDHGDLAQRPLDRDRRRGRPRGRAQGDRERPGRGPDQGQRAGRAVPEGRARADARSVPRGDARGDGPSRPRPGSGHGGRHRRPVPGPREPRRDPRKVGGPRVDAQPHADGRRGRPAVGPGRAAAPGLRSPNPPPLRTGRPRLGRPRLRPVELQVGALADGVPSSTRWAVANRWSTRRSGRAVLGTCSAG